MKYKYVGLVAALLSLNAIAYVIKDFPGWEQLQEQSSDIFICKCKRTPSQTTIIDGVEHEGRGLLDTEVEVLSVLKGSTNVDAPVLRSEFWPRQNEFYLVFANKGFGCYQANERYRVVALGMYVPTNNLSGMKLDEQIRSLLLHRLNNLKRQMGEDLKEKARLEAVPRSPETGR